MRGGAFGLGRSYPQHQAKAPPPIRETNHLEGRALPIRAQFSKSGDAIYALFCETRALANSALVVMKNTLPQSQQQFGVIGGPKRAAVRLGLNRTTLNNKMRKHGITRPRPE
jgi:DNA-binding NtrC family response regulator